MEKSRLSIGDFDLQYYSVANLIIGSGAAALNTAVSLHLMQQEDIVIATDRMDGGTSNNAGSDKQTYYKLSLAGNEPDSPFKMAEDLFNGHCMHGDIALCEAQGSAVGFLNLVRLGVPFPQNRYGAWVGYKTDHDPRARATSAGPYTSQKMFLALANEVKKRKIKILDKTRIIALLTSGKDESAKVIGALGINLKEKNYKKAFVIFNSVNTILGTGGPGGMYENSVYPLSQTGSTGMAFEAGATGQNLTESQFGIASVKFRWNLSGSYQQVIPRYFSTDRKGKNEREFLNEFFPDYKTLTRAIFLKGYQWPFDPEKIENYGSSLIDLLIYRETIFLGRKVFIDFRKNPGWSGVQKFSPGDLYKEVHDYLKNSGAIADTPFKRLELMNRPAIDLYLDNKIDLSCEPVEISVCAQHNNGGLKGNIWWESDLKHLFPVGEVNGSHGVYRPGGASLNSGQAGSHRAALYISRHYSYDPPERKTFLAEIKDQVEKKLQDASKILDHQGGNNKLEILKKIQHRMSAFGGIIRDPEKIERAVKEAESDLNILPAILSAASVKELADSFLLSDLCLTHYIYLEAIKTYIKSGGRSRGSYLVTGKNEYHPCGITEDDWNFSLCTYENEIENHILEIKYHNKVILKNMIEVRPIPEQELWFESVWKKNLEDNMTEA